MIFIHKAFSDRQFRFRRMILNKKIMRKFGFAILLTFAFSSTLTHLFAQTGWVWGTVQRSAAYGDFGLDVECDQYGNIHACGDYRDNCTIGGSLYPSFGSTDIYLSKQDPHGQYTWVKVQGSPATDRQFAIDLDENGYTYGAGYGLITFPVNRTSQHQWDALTIRYKPDGSVHWGRAMNGDIYSEGRDIAVDAMGNSYTVGFLKTYGFWGSDSIIGNGLEDAYVVKFDSTGRFQWAKNFGGTLDDQAYTVDIDPFGNIWVGGSFQGTSTFGGITIASTGASDGFIAKMSPSGTVQFVKPLTGTGNADVYRLKFSEDGSCYFAGNFTGNISIGSQTFASVDLEDVFYGKLDLSGNFQWAKQAGGNDLDLVQDIAIDEEENIYLGGYYFGTLDWQGSNLSSAGYDDAFLAKTDSNGNLLLLDGLHYANESVDIFGVSVDPAQNIVVTGKYAQQIIFGNDTFNSQNNSSDVFIAKYATRNQSIKILSIDGSPYCVGDNFQVHFQAFGNFEAGNLFELELSNASGSFATAIVIGSLQSSFGGTITGTIPSGIGAGSGYRVRIRSSLPQAISPDNGNNISLSPTTAIPVEIVGDTVLCSGMPNILSIDQGLSSQIWSTGDTAYYILVTSPQLIWVEATDANGCSNRDEVNVVNCVSNDAKMPSPKIEIFPNPSLQGSARLKLKDFELGGLEFEIIDMKGTLLTRKQIQIDQTEVEIQLPTQFLAKGIYLLRIEGGGKNFIQKLIIQ